MYCGPHAECEGDDTGGKHLHCASSARSRFIRWFKVYRIGYR
jgi:hypothetical protein